MPNGGILSKNLDTLFYSGSSHDRNQFGTIVFVNKKLNSKVVDYQDLGRRICKIWLRLKPHNITILSVHAATEDKNEKKKEEFYEKLKRAYDFASRFDMKIVMGDFNSKIGKEDVYFPTIGKHSLHDITNNNGYLLMNFASFKNMVIASTWFPHKHIHKGTWKAPGGNTINQIDHVMVDRRYASH